MPKVKTKIFAAVMFTLIGVVMLVMASVAWFTISTNPEVTGMQVSLKSEERIKVSSDGENWSETLNLSEQYAHLAPLKPVSTVDGLNWFLPVYNEDGSLKDVNEFELDDKLIHANSLIYSYDTEEEKWVKLTGDEYNDANNQGYYVYSDFYLKFEDPDAELAEGETEYMNVHLSFPNSYAESIDGVGDKDGTYVLPAYKINDDKTAIEDISNNAQNIVRVGFLVNPDYSGMNYNDTVAATAAAAGINKSDYSTNQFYIYEPNADQRTDTSKPITNADDETAADRYIVAYDYKGSAVDYNAGYYYETLPIEKTNTIDSSYTEGTKYIYDRARLNPDKLIPQKSSSWNLTSLLETYKDSLEQPVPTGKDRNQWWSSKDVNYPFGSFLNSYSLYNGVIINETSFDGLTLSTIGGTGAGLNLGSQPAGELSVYPYDNSANYSSCHSIITLKKDKPVRIRLFVWLEGQDIDCWNDVAAGGFVVNLELGGTVE